jgi:hypothetical protein
VNKGGIRALMWRCEAAQCPNVVSISASDIYKFFIYL